MLERKLELEDKIRIEENLRIPFPEDLVNCRFFIQKWDDTELESGRTQVVGPIGLYSIVNQSDEIKAQVINLFTAFCNVLEKTSETLESAQLIVNPPRRTREEEMKWMENNKELLAKLAGQWIAVEGSCLIAASEEFTKVSEEAKNKGIKVPFIVYLSEPTTDLTIGV